MVDPRISLASQPSQHGELAVQLETYGGRQWRYTLMYTCTHTTLSSHKDSIERENIRHVGNMAVSQLLLLDRSAPSWMEEGGS